MNTNPEIMPESPCTARCGAAIPAVDALGLIYLEGHKMEIPEGYCQCGCGKLTSLAEATSKRDGYTKGQPRKFIKNHALSGPKATNWKGGRKKNTRGYIMALAPGHPRADGDGYVMEHILIAERALGHYLPPKAQVHHANGSKDSGPLVICQDNAYHMLLHQRMRAYKACGHASWRKCNNCGQWDAPENFNYYKDKRPGRADQPYHRRAICNKQKEAKL